MLLRSFLLVGVLVACRSSRTDPPAAHDSQAAQRGQHDGTVGGHHVSITIAGGELAAQRPERMTWRLTGEASGEASVSDNGPRTAETAILVARSPRTIVRADGGIKVITEVVRECDGRMFACVYSETVDDPGSPRGQAARARGVAACTSLRVDRVPTASPRRGPRSGTRSAAIPR